MCKSCGCSHPPQLHDTQPALLPSDVQRGRALMVAADPPLYTPAGKGSAVTAAHSSTQAPSRSANLQGCACEYANVHEVPRPAYKPDCMYRVGPHVGPARAFADQTPISQSTSSILTAYSSHREHQQANGQDGSAHGHAGSAVNLKDGRRR